MPENAIPQIILLPPIEGQYQVKSVPSSQGDYKLIALQGITHPTVTKSLSGTISAGDSFQFTLGLPIIQEDGGQVSFEAEQFDARLNTGGQSWLTDTVLVGYSGESYIAALPDTDLRFTDPYTTATPELQYTIQFTTTGSYYVWLRGYAPNGAGDSLYLSLGSQPAVTLTGFPPRRWAWANEMADGTLATVQINEAGRHTLHLWLREDGLKVDRLLLTTDNIYVPVGDGPVESNLGLY